MASATGSGTAATTAVVIQRLIEGRIMKRRHLSLVVGVGAVDQGCRCLVFCADEIGPLAPVSPVCMRPCLLLNNISVSAFANLFPAFPVVFVAPVGSLLCFAL